MSKIDFTRAKILVIFVAVCICIASFMGACSDDGSQNTKTENNKNATPAASNGILDDSGETNKPPKATIEATDEQESDETFSTAVSVETNVPTSENTLSTENVVTPNISATEDADNSSTVHPIETGKPTVTSSPVETNKPVITSKPVVTNKPVTTSKPVITNKPVTTSKPVITNKPVATSKPVITNKPVATSNLTGTINPMTTAGKSTSKPTVTHQNTIKPTEVPLNTPKPTEKVTIAPMSTSAIATKAPTVVPTSQPTSTAKPTPTPVTFPVISAIKDSNYNSTTPTVVTVSETSTKITNSNGGVSQVSNGDIYIKLAGEYEFSGTMKNRSIIVQAPTTAKVIINLKGLNLTTAINTPISILSADKVEISANRDTTNVIDDKRAVSNPDIASGGAISSDCDLEIKGKGKLTVTSSYNNGIFTKDDLEVKNLTLSVTAPNNALKGNDSVTILSGNITLVTLDGNGIETKNFDVSSSGKQRGNIIISAGNINIKAGNDGINAAYSVNVTAGILIIEATDYSIDATNTITISANAQFTDKSNKGCNPAI